MNLKNGLILVSCFLVLAGCRQGKQDKRPETSQETIEKTISGNISISGAYALTPLAEKWADSFMEKYPGVKIEVIETGTGQGVANLLSKTVKLAMISRPLLDMEIESGIWVIPVAKDGIAPI